VLYTIGHSTHSQEEFTDLAHLAGVDVIYDVRGQPGSRRYPHFNQENMRGWLRSAGVDYVHDKRLGGRRSRKEWPGDERTATLRVDGFRSYAAYMLDSPDFPVAVDYLLRMASERRVAIMCAEVLWWRCHRRMISDYVTLARQVEVSHITGDGDKDPHKVFSAARLLGTQVMYDNIREDK